MDSCDKKTPEQAEALYRLIRSRINGPDNFAGANGIAITHLAENYAEGELTVVSQSMNPYGIIHGGCLTTLADTVAGCAVLTGGRVSVTMSSNMNYLAPAVGTKIRCVATPEKLGRTVCVYHCLLTNDQEQPVASGTFTFYILPKELVHVF